MIDRSEWPETMCLILDDVEKKCEEANLPVGPWRTETFCPVQCEANQSYKVDTSECLQTTENCQPGQEQICTSTKKVSMCKCNPDYPIWDTDRNKCINYCPAKMSNPRFGDNRYYDIAPWVSKPEYAIDGVFTTSRRFRSFAHSRYRLKVESTTFYVDLDTPASLSKVVIYPRRDCCHDRYTSTRVYVNGDVECHRVTYYSGWYVYRNLDEGLPFVCPNNVVAARIKVVNHHQHLQIAELVAEIASSDSREQRHATQFDLSL